MAEHALNRCNSLHYKIHTQKNSPTAHRPYIATATIRKHTLSHISSPLCAKNLISDSRMPHSIHNLCHEPFTPTTCEPPHMRHQSTPMQPTPTDDIGSRPSQRRHRSMPIRPTPQTISVHVNATHPVHCIGPRPCKSPNNGRRYTAMQPTPQTILVHAHATHPNDIGPSQCDPSHRGHRSTPMPSTA